MNRMKRFLIAVLAVLLASGAMAQQPPFPDVPAGHWAEDAVARIADLGIVIGFPDGTFRGNEGFTRYQAALVVSRLLDVIAEDIAAAQALTAEDLAALRNAVQELASDLAALGVRVGDVEADVDMLRADVAVLEDVPMRLADLEALVVQLIEAPDLEDLRNRVDQLELAVEAALARAEAAEALALEAVAPDVALRIDEFARQLEGLNEVVRMLTENVDDLELRVSALEVGVPPDEFDPALLGQIEQQARDIANLREFVTLLRREQVDTAERIAALEEQMERIDELEARLAAVEAQMLVFDGTLTLTFELGDVTDGLSFDVDRIFGVGQRRELDPSAFTTGARTDPTRPAQERSDIFSDPPEFDADLDVSFRIGEEAGIPGVGPFDDIDFVLELGLRRAVNLIDEDDEVFEGYVFEFRNIAATVDVAGVGPIQFQFGEAPEATFTPYVFQTLGPGFVATIGAPDFLAFIDPTITVAYGQAQREDDVDADPAIGVPEADDVQVLGLDATYFGVRLTLSPFAGFTVGGSVAQLERRDAPFLSHTGVLGADASLSLGFITIEGEFAMSTGRVVATAPNELEQETLIGDFGSDGETMLYYVQATLDGADIPILNTLTANYRNIPRRNIDPNNQIGAGNDQFYFGNEFGGAGDKPFRFDQEGFGVNAELDLFLLTLEGYFDQYTIHTSQTDPAAPTLTITAYGAETEVDLFLGFAVRGFYRDYDIAAPAGFEIPAARERTVGDFDQYRRTGAYERSLGGGLRHDGDAPNALIPGLNINLEYALLGPAATPGDFLFATPRITAEADYTLDVLGFTLEPYVSFVDRAWSEAASADRTIRAGTSLTTDPLDFFLRPSLHAAVNYRTSEIDPVAGGQNVGVYTATELQFAVGLRLEEFFFENSHLTVRYGYYEGVNMSLVRRSTNPDSADYATRIGEGPQNNDATQTTHGAEAVWDYFGLEFAYGMYWRTITGATGDFAGENRDQEGHRFRIRYVIDF